MEEKKKKFKKPSSYYWEFAWYAFFITVCLLLIIDFAFFETEEGLYKRFANQKLIGDARQRATQVFESFVVTNLGKNGMIAVLFLSLIVLIYEFYKTIAAYFRYKKKCRLSHEGVIKNFYDIYDDYEPLLSWRRIKALFSKKKKTYKKKYPSKRKMKRQIAEQERDINRDVKQ